jgi:hypothetical protein
MQTGAASPTISWWRLAVLAAASLYVGRFLFAPDAVMSSWMHMPTLVVHEAGHILFGPFGRFLMFLGGTLLQVALPLAFAVYFLLSRQPFSAALLLLWVSFALVDGAVYVADAQERALPLITFDPGTHDWWNLLGMLDLLHRDDLIAAMFHAQAFVALGAAGWLGWRSAQIAPASPASLR